MRPPSPPVVSAALSGFVVGVLVTLLATGVLKRSSEAPVKTTTPLPVVSVRDQALQSKLAKLVTKVLGPDPTGPKSRFLEAKIINVSKPNIGTVPPEVEERYRSVRIGFRLNDHPLGKTWRLREARADIFSLLKAIYTSGLPIYSTELVGRFNLPKQVPYTGVIAYITYNTAARIPWKRWGRTHEAQLWSLLDYHSVDHRFA